VGPAKHLVFGKFAAIEQPFPLKTKFFVHKISKKDVIGIQIALGF